MQTIIFDSNIIGNDIKENHKYKIKKNSTNSKEICDYVIQNNFINKIKFIEKEKNVKILKYLSFNKNTYYNNNNNNYFSYIINTAQLSDINKKSIKYNLPVNTKLMHNQCFTKKLWNICFNINNKNITIGPFSIYALIKYIDNELYFNNVLSLNKETNLIVKDKFEYNILYADFEEDLHYTLEAMIDIIKDNYLSINASSYKITLKDTLLLKKLAFEKYEFVNSIKYNLFVRNTLISNLFKNKYINEKQYNYLIGRELI